MITCYMLHKAKKEVHKISKQNLTQEAVFYLVKTPLSITDITTPIQRRFWLNEFAFCQESRHNRGY